MRPSEWLPIARRANARRARAEQDAAQHEAQKQQAAFARISALAHDTRKDPAPATHRPARRPARLGDSPC